MHFTRFHSALKFMGLTNLKLARLDYTTQKFHQQKNKTIQTAQLINAASGWFYVC